MEKIRARTFSIHGSFRSSCCVRVTADHGPTGTSPSVDLSLLLYPLSSPPPALVLSEDTFLLIWPRPLSMTADYLLLYVGDRHTQTHRQTPHEIVLRLYSMGNCWSNINIHLKQALYKSLRHGNVLTRAHTRAQTGIQ